METTNLGLAMPVVGGAPWRLTGDLLVCLVSEDQQGQTDLNGDGSPCTGVTDGDRLLMYLFRDGAPPPAPFPDCGTVEGDGAGKLPVAIQDTTDVRAWFVCDGPGRVSHGPRTTISSTRHRLWDVANGLRHVITSDSLCHTPPVGIRDHRKRR